MGSEIFHEFKRQASYFFTEKIKTARLVLTDVTPAELMTEEATKGNTGPPDIRTMGVISRAAFEVDDYWRIVEILHKRLFKFDRTNWRDFYKALILLEHLLTHGPRRVAEEFECDKDVIKEIGNFQYIDERGFNWGLKVKDSSERVLKLLESETLLKEERARARKLTHGIEGFGSFSQRSSSKDAIMKDSSFQRFGRSNSHCNEDQNPENESLVSSESLIKQGTRTAQQTHEGINSVLKEPENESDPWVGRSNSYWNDHQNPENESLISSKSLIKQGTRTAQQIHEGINLVPKEPENETDPLVSQGVRLRINVQSNSLFA